MQKLPTEGWSIYQQPYGKKYHIRDGDRIVFTEEEDGIKMHVIQPLEDLRKNSFTTEEMLEEMRKSRKEELELEF